MTQIPKSSPLKHDWRITFPLTLRVIAGFIATLTSAILTIIYILTIYVAVIENNMGFPGVTKTLLMMVGSTVSSWQFINVSSVLAVLFKTLSKEDKATQEKMAMDVGVVTPKDMSIEHELFGPFNVIMRALAGMFSAITVCSFSLVFAYINYKSVEVNKVYAGDMELAVVLLGPMIMSWTFMKASTTLKQLLKLDSVSDVVRNWLIKRLVK